LSNPPPLEGDDLWEALAPIVMSGPAALTEASSEIGLIGPLLRPGGNVLDLCCGTGRHSLALARAGFHVTGVDRNPALVHDARVRAQLEGVEIEYIQEDMRRFERPQGFDAVLNLGTSFGFFETSTEDFAVLQKAQTSLRGGGLLIMDMLNKEELARQGTLRAVFEGIGIRIVLERGFQPDGIWMTDRWVFVTDGGQHEYRIRFRPYSGGELQRLLEHAGFNSIDLWGDLSRTPYSHDAHRLVVVARP
jgi:SAM-dependent methyltransferase